MNQPDPAEIERPNGAMKEGVARVGLALADCRFLTLEWHDRTKTMSATCSCGKWSASTDENSPYRQHMFHIDRLVHDWAIRHRAGKS